MAASYFDIQKSLKLSQVLIFTTNEQNVLFVFDDACNILFTAHIANSFYV